MEAKLEALKLFLDALRIPADIDTVAERKRVQKAVYLGQLSGVDLGYRFGWYIMGPYSPPLTRDYYQLADALATSAGDISATLRPDASEKLAAVAPLLTVPSSVPLSQEDWMELLASYDYLRRVSGFSHEQTVTQLQREKSHVAAYVDQAVDALKKHGVGVGF